MNKFIKMKKKKNENKGSPYYSCHVSWKERELSMIYSPK